MAETAGVLPGDALLPLVEALADIPAEIEQRVARLEAETATQQTQILQRTEVRITAVERAATKPLMTSHQIKYDVLPRLVAAITGFQVLVATVLLVAAFCAGFYWQYSKLQCADQSDGSNVCYYYARQPSKAK